MRRYARPVLAYLSPTASRLSFTWHGREWHGTVISSWRLISQWWDDASAANRLYYRVQTVELAVFELYYEVARDIWVLDVCYD